MKKYDIQILQQDLKAQMVTYDKKEKETQMSSFDHIALSVNGQEINLPFQVIDILQHEIDLVRYSEYVREVWAEDYEGELSEEEAHKISEKMLDYLAQFGDEYEIEELNDRLKETNDEKNAALREERYRRLKENALHITGATLLSKEEAREVDKELLKADQNWWLSSYGYGDYVAACVFGDCGEVYNHGYNMDESFGVRPALKLSNLESSIYQIGDTLSFGDHSFTIISDKYALCDEIIEKRPFCNDCNKNKSEPNYETSDIKVFIDHWFDRTKELEAERTREDNLNKARQVFDEFTDVPMDPETECIESDWNQFSAGTHREEIWRWIEDTYHVSVEEDLMRDIEEPER